RAAVSVVGRGLVGVVVATADVAAGDVHRHVCVNGILVGLGLGDRLLFGLGRLFCELRLTVTATANLAAGGVRLRLTVALVRLGLVARAAVSVVGRGLVGVVVATADVAAGDVHRCVCVIGILL